METPVCRCVGVIPLLDHTQSLASRNSKILRSISSFAEVTAGCEMAQHRVETRVDHTALPTQYERTKRDRNQGAISIKTTVSYIWISHVSSSVYINASVVPSVENQFPVEQFPVETQPVENQ
jgi:hypothetical protein